MDKIFSTLKGEPVAVVAFFSTVLTLAVAFGVHLSDLQTGALIAVANGFFALVVRAKVEPVATQDPFAGE